MCFQDLAIMRAMPNMHVYSPCDVYELKAVMRYMANAKQPTYMQLIRPKVGKVFDESYVFNPNKAVVIKEGTDVTLVSTGYMTQFTPQVAEDLARDGLSVEVLHYLSIKPFDTETLIASAKKTGAVVTVENQNIIGGLGGAVCEILSENCPTKVRRLGIPDRFGEVATEEYLFEKHGFGPEHIKAVCAELAKK
jgi:transketolase